MDEVLEAHKKEYGEAPDVVAVAPGRFHLIGEHSWFFKDKTLSMAVNLPVYVAVSKRDDTNLRFRFVQLDDSKRASLSSLKFRKEDKWANAVKSVISGFSSGGFDCCGMNVTVYSDILPSAGFGITTAIKIASAWAIKELCRFRCRRVELLQVIERANKLYYGIANLKADNFTPIYSKEGCVVLTDYSRNECEAVPFKFKDKTIILTDARVPRITTWNEEACSSRKTPCYWASCGKPGRTYSGAGATRKTRQSGTKSCPSWTRTPAAASCASSRSTSAFWTPMPG